MAVAVLERDVETLEKESTNQLNVINANNARMTADELHNSKISEVYARLINSSNTSVDEVLGRTQQSSVVEKPRDILAQPYLVQNARATADIFRADSPINQRILGVQAQATATDSEEENEDLRPTSTTIQYKTYGVNKTVEEGIIKNTDAEKRAGLSKKEKIIIAVVVSVIVAMFALIIINSAIISGLNADLSSLQTSLTTVKASYAGVSDEVNSLLSNAVQDAIKFAESNGMVR